MLIQAKTRKPKPPLIDSLPEFYHYEDTGCEIARSCLRCPLPNCKYDDPHGFRKYRRLGHYGEMVQAMETENLTVAEAAARFAITERTMFRIISRYRQAVEELGAANELLAAA